MTIELRPTDIAVLKALLKDGRKSFREISRETGISTPTVKSKFNRLVNMGVIKSISPILDLDIISHIKKGGNRDNSIHLDTVMKQKDQEQHQLTKDKIVSKTTNGIAINLTCNYCKIPLSGRAHLLKFANIERFFCCKECRTVYKRKYAGRIESLTRRYSRSSAKTNNKY